MRQRIKFDTPKRVVVTTFNKHLCFTEIVAIYEKRMTFDTTWLVLVQADGLSNEVATEDIESTEVCDG